MTACICNSDFNHRSNFTPMLTCSQLKSTSFVHPHRRMGGAAEPQLGTEGITWQTREGDSLEALWAPAQTGDSAQRRASAPPCPGETVPMVRRAESSLGGCFLQTQATLEGQHVPPSPASPWCSPRENMKPGLVTRISWGKWEKERSVHNVHADDAALPRQPKHKC